MADVTDAYISVKVRSSQGRLKFRTGVLTSDGSGTTMPAALFGMSYIDHAIVSCQRAALSSVADYNYLSENSSSTVVTLAGAGSSGAEMDFQVWGW